MALVLLAGCNSPAARVDEAKGYVQLALELWQKGGKPVELSSRTPPIEFQEAIWNAGEKLVSFFSALPATTPGTTSSGARPA